MCGISSKLMTRSNTLPMEFKSSIERNESINYMKTLTLRQYKKKVIFPILPFAKEIMGMITEHGLIKGAGNRKNEFCIEQAISIVENRRLGLPYVPAEGISDEPRCVDADVRDAKIALNDHPWSSRKARAKGMLKLAIAQLGSNTLEKEAFHEALVQETDTALDGYNDKRNSKEPTKPVLPELPGVHEAHHIDAYVVSLIEYKNNLEKFREKMNRWATKYSGLEGETPGGLVRFLIKNAPKGKGKDNKFLFAADVILKALIKVKSPGCKYLYLVK